VRRLSYQFIDTLKYGFLSGIKEVVIGDKDLDLQIRDNYINIYYKGNSLLKLDEVNERKYSVYIHPNLLRSVTIKDLIDKKTTSEFIGQIPKLKENIINYGVKSLELEYEQLIIRANNNEKRNNSEYFFIDRQYSTKEGRFDLTGIYWKWEGRRRGQVVPLCFMEIKFALNQDIKDVHSQIKRYNEAIKGKTNRIARESEKILEQKLELGLFDQDPKRIEAMKTLKISEDIDEYQFILVLVDYNPFSKSLDLDKIKALPFAEQVKIYYGGFAMWERNLSSYPNLSFGG
jgi:hypothetical protein